MATQIIGSFAVNNLLPIQSRAAGTVNFGPFAVPVGYSGLNISFDLQQVQSLTAVLTAHVEVSFDGGVTWPNVQDLGLDLAQSGYRLVGNVLMRALNDPYGPGPVRIFGAPVRLMQTDSSQRQVRGTLSASESLISGVSLIGI